MRVQTKQPAAPTQNQSQQPLPQPAQQQSTPQVEHSQSTTPSTPNSPSALLNVRPPNLGQPAANPSSPGTQKQSNEASTPISEKAPSIKETAASLSESPQLERQQVSQGEPSPRGETLHPLSAKPSLSSMIERPSHLAQPAADALSPGAQKQANEASP